ncbi:MAG TPA: hypothetical protein VMV74_12060 [Bacteroidales bacterium]|nr:hypothetical protein [Bacteroidales bacterium]
MSDRQIIGLEQLDYIRRNRYRRTLDFMLKHITPSDHITDLGTPNPLSEVMVKNGLNVTNTGGEDFDTEYHKIAEYEGDVTTSFEVFEHLLAPYNILREIRTRKLIVSVPLRLWFAKAYWNENSEWDRHYHEFEKRQFDWLLEKSGWKIVDSESWAAPIKAIGIRPLLRLITKRYYIVFCERKQQ